MLTHSSDVVVTCLSSPIVPQLCGDRWVRRHPLIEEYVTVIMEPATGILHSCQPWVSRKFSCQEDAEGEDERESASPDSFQGVVTTWDL